MDLELTADQQLLLSTTEKFLAAHWPIPALRAQLPWPAGLDRPLWKRGADLGWTAMLVPEEFGGGTVSGDGVRDLGIIAEELGRYLVPAPVLATNVVAYALSRSESGDLREEHLPRIAAGEEVAVWATAGAGGSQAGEAPRATGTGSGYRLNGVFRVVESADVADVLLVTARASEGAIQLVLPAGTPGLSVEPLHGLDLTRRFCRVSCRDVELPESAVVRPGSRDDLDQQLALALALQCGETVGATDRLFTTTLEYVRERKSFGRPIGSYQAIKHRLADMLLWLESAKAAASAAFGAVQSGEDSLTTASVAKAYVAQRCPGIARECLQLHGGIGFTWEHDVHLYLRRVEANAIVLGDAGYFLDRLAETIGLGASEAASGQPPSQAERGGTHE